MNRSGSQYRLYDSMSFQKMSCDHNNLSMTTMYVPTITIYVYIYHINIEHKKIFQFKKKKETMPLQTDNIMPLHVF